MIPVTLVAAATADESRAKFERDLIEMIKASKLNEGKLQIATWSSGDLRKARQPVKRKGTAASASSTVTNAQASNSNNNNNKRQGRKQAPNLDGSIASASSVKKKRKVCKEKKNDLNQG
jgi:hypothetical protein